MEEKKEISLEEIMDRLDDTVTQMENDKMTLEESNQAFSEGMKLVKMGNDQFGVSVAFSATNISDDDLLDHIARNTHFNELVKDYKIILIAVNMNEESA